MAKERTEKKDKREKKEKRAEKDGVSKTSKKEKKEKKDKVALADAVEKELTTKVLDGIDQAATEAPVNGAEAEHMDVDSRPVGAIVPFASPLVEDKSAKKVLKSVKKAAVNKCLKRGVKEVVKALRKSPIPAANASIGVPNGVVILAADISPMDVISHIPVLCEDHGIPYVFVTSRAELGNSAATKRPTSVVMVVPKSASKGKKKDGEDDGEDFTEVFEELAKLAQKEAKKVNLNTDEIKGLVPSILRRISTKLTRWDSIYFNEAARRGHLFEQEWAFSYAFSKFINLLASGLAHTGALPYEFKESILGIAISHAAHATSVVVLYHLACTIFPGTQGRKLAFIASCLHIISPAGLFLSAPCTESTYSLLSFTGTLLFAQSFGARGISTSIKDSFLVLAGILYGLSTAVRGNGLLNGILLLEEACRVLYSLTQAFSFAKLRRLVAVGCGGICTGVGFVLPQYVAYQQFCSTLTATNEDSSREWCHRTLPSIYSFVQDHYWDNGFLRYWTLSNVPLFALASPMLAILVCSAFWTLGVGYSRKKMPTNTAQQEFPNGILTGRLLRSLAAPQITLTVMVFFCNHVQITTRLASGYPVWYIWTATLIMNRYIGPSSASKRQLEERTNSANGYWQIIVQYMVIYAAVQGVLFAAFLPPA
ncbi:CAZyme family GT76 [Aspergillus niger]|nr:CAZyme family GT76 [Aspergillus niger]KAI3051773.1 CAZyme family GT76 [Aspergillus niger]